MTTYQTKLREARLSLAAAIRHLIAASKAAPKNEAPWVWGIEKQVVSQYLELRNEEGSP